MTIQTHTVIAPKLSGAARWRKSSYSGDHASACVEIADLTNTSYHRVAIRDSKDPSGPAIVLPPHAFTAFIADIRQRRVGS